MCALREGDAPGSGGDGAGEGQGEADGLDAETGNVGPDEGPEVDGW